MLLSACFGKMICLWKQRTYDFGKIASNAEKQPNLPQKLQLTLQSRPGLADKYNNYRIHGCLGIYVTLVTHTAYKIKQNTY